MWRLATVKKVILGIVALLLSAQSSAYGQQLVLPIGKNATNQQSPSNPQCVELDIGGSVYSAANPIPAQLSAGNAAVSSTNPLYVLPVNGSGAAAPASLVQGGSALSTTNGLYTNLLQGNAVLSATKGLFSNILQGDAVLSATHGLFTNVLQGDAVISATNGLYTNLLQGNAVISATNTLPVRPSADGTNPVDATHGLYTNLLQGNAVNANANPIFTSESGVANAAATSSVTAQVDGVADTLTFTAASRHLVFANNDSGDLLHIALTGTATTSSFALPIGRTVTIDLPFAVTTVSVISSGAATDFAYLAY
jgi:hypothetical protein